MFNHRFISVKYFKKIVLIVVVFTMVLSCSTKKDTLINRNFHAVTTKFNVLFNGKEAFNKGLIALNDEYKDDWFKRLLIEPIKFDEDKFVISKSYSGIGGGFDKGNQEVKKATTPFGIAEEKAVKAIQKHGMNVNGTERNRQIDDAYLLLGKSRYYEQRFIPAIEAFNYIIANYQNASLIYETKIWRAKANIRIDNEEFAIETLKLLLDIKDQIEDISYEVKEEAHTALAMAYIKTDSLQKAKEQLIKATATLKNKNQAARNLFILGQMYNAENKKDSALLVFNKLIDFRRAPYKYKMHANIELAKNTTNDSTSAVILAKMTKLIKNRDNRAYLDALYYQVGFLHEKNDSIHLAKEFYNKSLRAKSGSDKQKTFSFQHLGDIHFKESNYVLASSYYDSVLAISVDSLDIRIRRIKRKHKNLASLIKFEKLLVKNDSILRIAALSKTDQETYFQNYIDNLKKKDEEAAQLRLNQQAFGASFGGNSLQSNNNKGKWYFYNSQSSSFGKAEFLKIWGDRKLEDNWRWSSKASENVAETDSIQENKVNLRYDLASYIQTIPTDKKVIDTLIIDRNQALYELGIIYKEQFKNPKLAIEKLERVATLNPKKELILPINWHLYNVHKDLGDVTNSDKYKNVILRDYAKTKFAQVIKNPDKQVEELIPVNEAEDLYKKLYYLYKRDKFEETIEVIDKALPILKSTKLIAKFELLKAYAIGKFKDREAYKAAMDFVAVSYGNTEEGKQAKKIVKQLTTTTTN